MTTYYSNYGTGSDSTGTGTAGNPWKTTAKFLTSASNNDTLKWDGATPFRERNLSTSLTGLIMESVDPDNPAVLTTGELFASWSAAATTTNVYEAVYTGSTVLAVWEPDKKLTSVGSLALCDSTPDSYRFDAAADRIYINIGQPNTDPAPTEIYALINAQFFITFNGAGNTFRYAMFKWSANMVDAPAQTFIDTVPAEYSGESSTTQSFRTAANGTRIRNCNHVLSEQSFFRGTSACSNVSLANNTAVVTTPQADYVYTVEGGTGHVFADCFGDGGAQGVFNLEGNGTIGKVLRCEATGYHRAGYAANNGATLILKWSLGYTTAANAGVEKYGCAVDKDTFTSHLYAYHNTFANNQRDTGAVSPSAGIYINTDGVVELYNNISYANFRGIHLTASWTPSSFIHQYNNSYGNSVANYSGFSAHATDMSVDPLFTDDATNDYTLQALSDLIDAGLVITPNINEGYKGSAPDVGYWEYDPGTPIAPDYRGYTTASVAGGTASLTVLRPDQLVRGDMLIAVIQNQNQGAITPPTGWTAVDSEAPGSDYKAFVYTLLSGDDDVGVLSYTLTRGDTTGRFHVTLLVYRDADGVHTSTGASGDDVSAPTTVTAGAVTTTRNRARIVAIFTAYTAAASADWSVPAGYTQQVEIDTSGEPALNISDKEQTTAGSVSAATSDLSLTATRFAGFHLALTPLDIIIVKHNQMRVDDIVYMEAAGFVEFMRILEGPTGSGPYSYVVQRDLDGTGRNDWYAGDAVFNTGQTGNGFIDLYSVRGVNSASEQGPTIAFNVRNSLTFNDWTEHGGLGNLNGLYDYGVDTYGAAFGKADSSWIAADATNGIRIMSGAIKLAQWDISGNILVGRTGASQSNVYITAGEVKLRTDTTDYIKLSSAGVITVGQVAASQGNVLISSGQIDLRVNTTSYINLTTAGVLTVGQVAASQSNVQISSGAISLRNNTTTKIQLQADGDIFIGTDISAAATTNLAIFTAAQTYNGESVDTGDLLLGDNSSSKANIFWDKSVGKLNFRGGTSVQAYIDTTGAIHAAGGDVVLDVNGVLLKQLGEAGGYLKFTNADITTYTTGFAFANLQKTNPKGGTTGVFNVGYALKTDAGFERQSNISFYNQEIDMLIWHGGAANYAFQLTQEKLFLEGAYLQTDKYLAIKDGVTAPGTLTGYALIYVDTADGDLKCKFGDGTVKTIVVDT